MTGVEYPYVELPGKGFLPYVLVSLGHGESLTDNLFFLVDSGAMLSFAPKAALEEIHPGIHELEEHPSGCIDAQGKEITGTPLTVTVVINGLPFIREEIWFSTHTRLRMLGETFFEKVDAQFRNFQPNRHFILKKPGA